MGVVSELAESAELVAEGEGERSRTLMMQMSFRLFNLSGDKPLSVGAMGIAMRVEVFW